MRGNGARTAERLAGACACALTALALAGCGPGATEEGNNPPSSAPSTSESAPSPSTQSIPRTKPGAGPHATRTLKGRLVEPVEAGCVLLETEDGSYLLLGVSAEIRKLGPGTELVVRGSVAESTMTTCQQGRPFKVESANRA